MARLCAFWYCGSRHFFRLAVSPSTPFVVEGSHRYNLSGPFTDHKLCYSYKCFFSLVNADCTFSYSPISPNNVQAAFSACIISRDYASATKQSGIVSPTKCLAADCGQVGQFLSTLWHFAAHTCTNAHILIHPSVYCQYDSIRLIELTTQCTADCRCGRRWRCRSNENHKQYFHVHRT